MIMIFFTAGVNGILEAYQGAVRQVRLFGPTNFCPVIRHVTGFACKAAETGKANVS